MKYILLPDDKIRSLSFYLAMEEYVARCIDAHECFFMWQVEPSVIFGRNQLIENEVNVDFCKKNGIQMYRRKSGGGCVYADLNNIMFSYITSADNVGFTFYKYLNLITLILRKIGIEATVSRRNDIMIDGKKVSGNSFYHIPGRSIVHGTMLFDTNMFNMTGSITPDSSKLTSKGVQSVRQHIALLKDYVDIDIDTFKDKVRNILCDDSISLTHLDVENIFNLEKEYLSEEFIYGNNPKYKIVKKSRIDGVGEVEVCMEIKNKHIKSISLLGDFIIVGDLELVLQSVKGVSMEYNSLYEALPDNMSEVILNLKKEDFINLLLK